MFRRIVWRNCIREIQVISFCIEVCIRNPIVKIFECFFVSPEKLEAAGIASSMVVYGRITTINKAGLDQLLIFFVIELSPKHALITLNEILSNVMCRFEKSERICRRQILRLRCLIENAV